MTRGISARDLEVLHARYNVRAFAHPDPVELLYAYGRVRDREIAALVASSLAFGKVRHILASASRALDILDPPGETLARASRARLARAFAGFRHRFVDGAAMAALVSAAGRIIEEHGSLEACFLSNLEAGHESVLPALSAFACSLISASGGRCGFLVPDPGRGSAMKRLNLMLRWMVRRDAVDPGGWKGVDRAKLIVPLDTHMHRVGVELGFTVRARADMRAALEVTAGFRMICPSDPVRYDFALTRPGILGLAGRPAGSGRGRPYVSGR